MRAIIYLRQSQATDDAAISRQREDCTALIRQRGWPQVGEYADNDISGSGEKHRPAFDALLEEIEAGRADAIVAWSLDRLTRNRRDQVRLVETCEPKQTVIALARGSDLDLSTPAGRLSADILASVARNEIEVKADRQRRQQQQAAAQGRRVGGKRPMGYLVDGMTINEPEAELIRRAYIDALAGVPLAQIARDWQASGVVEGRRHYSTVRAILLNPRYAGLRAHRGEIVAPAQWPALVPMETWEAVQALLRDPGRRNTVGRTPLNLLTGIALCGHCPEPNPVHGGGARYGGRTYRCRTQKHIARQAGPVDQWVTYVLLERLSQSDAVDLLEDRQRPDVEGLRQQAVALRSRLQSIAVEFADDDTVSLSQFRAMTERLRERLRKAEAELADAGRVDLLGPLVHASDIEAAWGSGSFGLARQRRVIGMLMTITLYGAGRGAHKFNSETVRIEPR